MFQQPPPQFLDLELGLLDRGYCEDDNYPSGLQSSTSTTRSYACRETVLSSCLPRAANRSRPPNAARGRPGRCFRQPGVNGEKLMDPWHSWLNSHQLMLS